MYKFTLKIIDKNNNCNNGGFYNTTPFKISENNIIIKFNFYKEETWFYNILQRKYNNVLISWFDEVDITTINDLWWDIYYLYISYFFTDYYHHVLKYDNIIIKLSNVQKEYIKNNNYNELSNLYTHIEEILLKYNNSFIKTTGFSPKKVNNIIPFDSNSKGIDVIKYLFSNKNDRCMKFINYSNIFIQKWNDNITLDRELRIFIKNKEIIAISQQDCSKSYVFLNCLSYNYKEICNNCNKLWLSIKEKIFYTNCILDVYIDDNLDIHLIEINPTHSWTGAGSALFEWNNDPPNNYEFRLI
jgi:hypothetical protein